MASQHEDSSESDGETEPTKCFHRRLSTNKDIRYNSFIKEGFLNKQNGSFQRWHKRYFKLKSGVLYYSKDKKSTIFNQIDLIDSSIAERSLKNINHSFQVITPFRNLVLCAATRSEMKGWVSALRAAASKDVREVTSEMAELSSLSDHHNWCVLPNIRPIFCNVCHESLHRVTRSGVTINGLACEVCKFRTHKKCASKSPSTCKWTTLASMGGNIIEDENGDLMMPHQWMMGNFPVSSKCSVCEKPCSSVLKLQDYWCLWCHCTVHTACKDQTVRCSLGPARVSILPPISITNFDEGGFWRASKSPNTSPLLVFLNSKSGDSQGVKMLRRFKQLLNPAQVFDLMNGGPKIGLRLFQNFESFRVLVCGGDGSVGWVLNEIDRLGLHKQCQVGVLPLGTGNDLSRVLGWGASFDDDTQLPALLEKLEHAQIQMFDRWSIYSYETDQTRNRSLTIDPICAYEDTASNHLSRILHSDSHNVVISSAMVLCSIVQDLVSKVGQSFEDTEGCSADKDSFAYKCLTLNQKMEALLKTLAEESTIGQSEHEQKNSPRLRSSSADRPVVILFDEPPPPSLLLSSSAPSSSLSSAPSSSSSSASAASAKTLVGNGVRDEIISVQTSSTAREHESSRIVTSFSVSSSSSHPSSSHPPSSSSSSSQGASTAATTCLPQIQSANACAYPLITSSSLPFPPASSSSSSSSPPISSSSSTTTYSTAPLLTPLSCYFPRSSLSSVHPSSSSSSSSSVPPQPPPSSSSSSSSSAQTSTFSTSKPLSSSSVAPSAGQRSPRVQKGTVRSKEQLMCRANSLKKAIRQIVELTEKAVDEQNHQTNQFDKDNERTMSEIISTTTLVASLLSSPDRTLADTLSIRRPSDDRGPFVIVTGDEGLHGSCNGDLASAPPVDNYETHSMKLAASTVENLVPAKNPSREPTPIIFNYQLCDNLPYVNTSSSLTVATHTLAKSPPGKSTTHDSLLSPSHPYTPSPLVCSALTPSAPGSSQVFDFCRSSVSPSHVYTASGPVPSCDIPSVNVVDDSILDNEVSQVMHDVNGVEKNHLVVPGSHHYHHHHHLNSHHHHQYCLSPQQHHHHHHHHDHHNHQTNRHHHHHQFKDPNTLIAQHHLHVYSSSDGEASRSSTPRSPQNCPLNLVDRWSPLFGMPADRTNSPSPYFFEHQTDGKLSHNVSPSKACSNHSGSGRHLSSLSTLYRAPDNPPVAQSGLRHSQKSPEGIQFPLLNVPLLQALPKQVIGKGRKSSPIHSSLISRALMANADALCAPASPLNDLANINLDDFTEKCVMNNYFGIGLDAKIALDFHNKREEHPKKCRSRTKNMMWYGVLGGKEILQRTHKNLDQKVRLECDGKLIPLPNLQGIVILNIPSYMGGTNFWGGSKEDEYFIAPSFDDKVLEVVAVFGSIQLGISRVINIQRHRIAQCHTVRITIIGDEGLPVQVDGEAWIQNPGVVWIQHKNRAQVLIRDRAFEEALKIWTEKQKLERTTPREPPLSESELATLATFTEASRDLFEKVTRELELSPPAQALNFVDGFAAKTSTISTDGKVPPRISRGEVMEFASHVRSFCYEVRRSVLQSQSTKEELDDDRLRNVLEFLEDNSDKVHNMGAQFYERQRNKDRLKLLFKLPKSSRKHRDGAMESLKPEVLNIRDWTHVDVAQWLNALDLGEYAEVFVAHDIRGSELLTLGRTDLKELGIVKVGHLKRLQQEIKFIKEHLKSIEGRRVRNISDDSTTASSQLAPVQAPLLMSPPHQPAVESGDATLPDVIATSSSQETSRALLRGAFGVEQANSSSSSSA